MSLIGDCETLLKRLATLPPVRSLREREYENEFAGNCFGCFKGVYRTFSEAAESAPRTKPFGWNLPEFANADIFNDRLTKVFPYDYPVLFWLKSLLRPGSTVIDVGGNVGIHFYAYAKYLTYPANLRWIVCDVPEVINVGGEMALLRGVSGLEFTTAFAEVANADILVSAGALQYVETPSFSASLEKLGRRPSHLLLNKLPLHDGQSFVTLQNGGPHFIAQHIFNRADFVRSVESVGYRLVDAWDDPMHSCWIPFHAERSVPAYSGLYFRAS
jgi:putative methyltransferase (TIGR04325 family)